MPKEDEKNEHLAWLKELGDAQEADLDQRQHARECDRFVLDKDGQWEERIARRLDSEKRPRYTFDETTPAIENIMADIEDMDFGCNVRPLSGDADGGIAETLEGMIRTIETDSNATAMYRKACRRVLRRGFDAWIVKAKFKDEMSFDQDLVVESIPNAINRVWMSSTSSQEDSSDSPFAYVMTSVSPAAYKKQFPKGSGISVDDADLGEHYDQYRPEVIVFGEKYYEKEVVVEVAQMSDGSVKEMNDEFLLVQDELAAQGITVQRTKKAKSKRIYHRFFDGGGMLSEERETVFRTMNIVTIYGNYELLGENSKINYYGMVQKLMDYQRVLNYAKSREIEEGALSPRQKTWMTKNQAKGHEKELASMNVNAAPVQFYNADGEAPPPYTQPPTQINPHLSTVGESMSIGIQKTSGINNAMNGDFAGRMSEEALKLQIERGTGGTRKWVNALENGIKRTCEILIDTIPHVYDTKRQFAITGNDGAEEMVTLNDEIYDQQTGQMVRVNTMNQGKYKVASSAGAAYRSKMEAGLAALLDYAAIDPTITATAGDLMVRSIDAPYMKEVADRKRAQLLQQGMIPFEQMTDEEKEQAQAQAQNQQPDAAMVMAQAEMMKGQADMLEQQNRQAEIQLEAGKINASAQEASHKLWLQSQKQEADIANTNADTIKKITEAEKTSGETFSNQLSDLQSIRPDTSKNN